MKLTHGMKIVNEHEGVKRVMSLQRYDDDGEACFLIMIETTAPDGEVCTTDIPLSEYGFAMFCEFMRRAPGDLGRFEKAQK